MKKRLPTYFISHGGGPWPYLKSEYGDTYQKLEDSLNQMRKEISEKPKAILMISGHWEERDFTLSSASKPPMIYDYYGFPEATYHIQYPAPGSPELASRVKNILESAQIKVNLDAERGYDHGTFVPMAVLCPEADIPIVQLSMKSSYDPKSHLEIGRLLAPLRDEGILIIGSGLSYHNLRQFGGPIGTPASREFDRWLNQTLINEGLSERSQKLCEWSQAPSARIAHPREDHLIPLFVALGAAENEEAHLTYHEDQFMGALTISSFRFGSV